MSKKHPITRYTIASKAEEFCCERCGYPLYIHDTAHYSEILDQPFCTLRCAKLEEENEAAEMRQENQTP